MRTLNPAPIRYQQLNWQPATRIFTGEISSLNGLGRVYPDSCDEGFTIIGKTGRAVVFVVNHVEVDRRENELLWWDLIPADPADRALVKGARIFND